MILLKKIGAFLPGPIKRIAWRIGQGVVRPTRQAHDIGRSTPIFWGGMTTRTLPPWENNPDSVSQEVASIHEEFKERLKEKSIELSMYRDQENLLEFIDQYLWREYIMATSVLLAVKSVTAETTFFLVEGGVEGGRGGWFAMKTAANHVTDFEYWAYDSWGAMRTDELLPSEIGRAGSYDYLDDEEARTNLSEFSDRVRFCKGFVPESLAEFDGPAHVHWLHIDLNAALPSEAMLSHFWHRIPQGGIVLLDDYSWDGHTDMKILADRFFERHGNWVIALPTGQGLVIKSS